MNAPDLHQLQRQVAALTRKVESLEAELSRRNAFDAPMSNVTLHERRRYEFVAQMAKPRLLVNFSATNTTTGTTISCEQFSAAQLERFALRFARLFKPSRKLWRGNRAAFGVMRDLFHQHGAIVRHGGSRTWAWAVYEAERRVIAARIAATLSRK